LYLSRTIENLAATLPEGGEIVIVDDCSTDGSTDCLPARRKVRLLRPAQRLGAIVGRNFGARHAAAPILVFSDAHIETPRNWFEPMKRALQRPEVGAVGTVYSEMNCRQSKGYGLRFTDASLNWTWLDLQSSGPYPVPMLGGFFLGMRRDVFAKIGGFDPGLITWGMEDVEIAVRIWTLGYQCLLIPTVDVAHLSRQNDSFPGYQCDWETGLHNTLRVAILHFGPDRIRRVVQHYAGDPCFPKALARILTGDTWAVRSKLHQIRKYDDSWFFQKFRMSL